MQPRTRRSCKWETSGRLGIFMPQISCNENIKNITKHAMKNLPKTIKNTATWHLHHASRVQYLLGKQRTQSTDTIPSNNKQEWAAMTTNKTKITIFILIKNWRQVVLLWFPLQVWPSTAKLSQKSKKKEVSCSFLHNDLYFTDTVLMGLNFIDADLNRPDDVTNPFGFNKWRSTASRTSENTTSTKYFEIVQNKSELHHSSRHLRYNFYGLDHMPYQLSIWKHSKGNKFTLLKLGYYLLKVPVNRHLQPSSHPKKMAGSVGSVT